MTLETWHKITDGTIVETVRVSVAPQGIATGPDGNPVWRIEVSDPPPVEGTDYDATTQNVASATIIEATQVRQSYTVTEKSLDDSKRSAWDEANAIRFSREAAGFSHAGNSWQSDNLSAQRLQQIRGKAEMVEKRAPGMFSGIVRTTDNKNITVNYNELSALYEAMNDHYQAAFDAVIPVKDQIGAATTNEEIRSIMAGVSRAAGRKR